MDKRIHSLIKNCILFESASSDALEQALSMDCNYERFYNKGDDICSPSNVDRQLVVILSGSATVHSSDPEKRVLLRTLSRGDVFGVANLFERDESFVTQINAKTRCHAFIIGVDAVSYLLENDSNFMYSYLSFLTDRIRFLNKKIMFYTCGSAERRIALYLCSFKSEVVDLSISMNLLAELLDIGRASLYRGFEKLESDGFIQRQSDKIILDYQKMIKYFNLKEGIQQ